MKYFLTKKILRARRKSCMSDLIRDPFKGIIDFFGSRAAADWKEYGVDSLFKSGNFLVDLIEDEGEYIVKAEIPGVEKDNISIDLSPEGQLTLSYNKKEKREITGRYFRKEISSGSFSRSFLFQPDSIKSDEIDANYKDGILIIKIPKVVLPPKKKMKKIEVK